MADLGSMNIKIGADISDALTKINQLKQANIQLAEETGALSTAYKKNATELRDLEKAQQTGIGITSQTANRIAALRQQQEGLTASIVDNKGVLKLSTEAVKSYDKSLTGAATTHNKLSSAVERLTNIQDIAAKGVTRLERAFGTFLETGVVGLAIAISGPLIEAFTQWYESISPVQKALSAMNVALAEAAGSVTGEVVQLQSLVSIAKDTSLSYAARTQAIKELNKEYPELHGNITLENVNTAAVTAQINKEIEAIKRRAQAKALEKLIDEESVKIEKAKVEGNEKIANQTKRQNSEFAKFANKVAEGLGAPGLFAEVSDAGDHFNTIIEEGSTKIDLYSKKLNELNTVSAVAGTLFEDTGKHATKAAKEVETIAGVLAKVNHQIEVLGKEEILFNTDKAKEKISALDGAIKHLFDKFNLPTDNSNVIDLKFRINAIEELERVRKLMPELIKKDFGAALTLPLTVTGPKPIEIKKALLPLSDSVKQELLAVGQVFTDFKNNTLVGLGEAIGEALAGGKDTFKNLFGGIFTTLGNALEQLGKIAIGVGVGIKSIKKAFESLNPIVAIVAGIGLIALGALIKSSVAKVGGFAQGGEVKGHGTGTSDSILARLSKGEYVIKESAVRRIGVKNLDRMNSGVKPPSFEEFYKGIRIPKFALGGLVPDINQQSSLLSGITGGAQVFIPEVKIKGNDLVLVFNRAQKTISRNS